MLSNIPSILQSDNKKRYNHYKRTGKKVVICMLVFYLFIFIVFCHLFAKKNT